MSRAIKNVGDALIHERGLELLRAADPDVDYVRGRGWQSLSEQFSSSDIGRIRRIVVPGGPGIRPNLRRIYPFLSEAAERGIPVTFLGVGARYFPAAVPDRNAVLDADTVALLVHAARGGPIGVRDHFSRRVIEMSGIAAELNGCPAWYCLGTVDSQPVMPDQFTTVAFTPPADPLFHEQSLAVLRSIRRLLPDARVVVGFHRGILADEHTGIEEERRNLAVVREAESLRCNVVDCAGPVARLNAYDACQLHVGYRVHAHLYFTSLHRPTFLIAEDVRGLGALHALDGCGVAGWRAPEAVAVDAGEVVSWLEIALRRYGDEGQRILESVAAAVRWHLRHRMWPAVVRATSA